MSHSEFGHTATSITKIGRGDECDGSKFALSGLDGRQWCWDSRSSSGAVCERGMQFGAYDGPLADGGADPLD